MAEEAPATEESVTRNSRKVLLRLAAMFVVVWIVLGGYALLSDGELSFAGITLRKSAIEDTLEAPPPPPPAPAAPRPGVAQPTAGATGSTAPSAAPAASRPVDASPQRILMFGDSMIDELMLRLAEYCTHNGHKLHVAIWYAAGTADWGADNKLDTLVNELDPTYVIAVLGSNEIAVRNVKVREVSIANIKKKLGDRPLVWIGPPNWQKDSGINDLFARVLGSGYFFRSEGIELDRKEDGIHPTREASARWMDLAARWIMESSAVPIKLDPPSADAVSRTERPVARTFAPPR